MVGRAAVIGAANSRGAAKPRETTGGAGVAAKARVVGAGAACRGAAAETTSAGAATAWRPADGRDPKTGAAEIVGRVVTGRERLT